MTKIKELISQLRAMVALTNETPRIPALPRQLATEAASALEALISRSAVMEEALAEMLAAFEAAETRGVPESELQPILRRARSALSQSGKE